MPHQPSNLSPFSPAPIRDYARAAVEAAREDERRGVLAWRIASHLCARVRVLTGQATAELAHLRDGEQEFYLNLARSVIALGDAIDATAPPSTVERLQHQQRRARTLARVRARTEAARRGHHLETFRPSQPGYELACCRACGAGVSIHLETAGISAARQLDLPCEPVR